MNIKKMLTTLSAMVVAVTMVMPSASVFGAEYSQELQDAYNWAYGKGVTTMSPIDNANMYGAITRSEMAKMLSVYATEVLGKKPDTSAACTFTDIDSVKGDLHDYIIESCQLGIMGQKITAFRPYDTISRAEFGTALSRVLWGSENEGGTPYYAKHLDALKANGIMNQIANAESTKEIRGYVMLMLMRSEANSVDCKDPTIALACLDPENEEMYKECPAACREDSNKTDEDGNVVKSGDLAVTAKAASDRRVIVSGIDGDKDTVSDLDTLTFKTSEEVEISKVVLERYGYSSNEDVEAVWLEDEDSNVISNEATLNSKGQANLTIKKDYRKVDGAFSATVVLRMKAGSEAGKTIGFKVIDVVSTAKNVDLGNYTPYTYDTVVYNGAEVTFTIRGTTKDYNLEAGKSYEVSKFKVKAPADSALIVKGFTLTNLAGTEQADAVDPDNNYDYSDLKQLDVEKFMDEAIVKVNGKEVKASASVNKDDELVISFKDDVEIAAKENAEFTVEMSFVEDFDAYDSSIVYGIAQASHFNAIDAKTKSRVSMPSDEEMAGKSWPTYTIRGGKVKLTNTKLGNIDGAIDSVDVQIAEGEITVGETIKGNLTVNIAPNPVPGAIVAMRLQIAGDEYEGKPDVKAAPTRFDFSNVEIEKGGKIKLLVDITDKTEIGGDDVEGGQYGFTLDGWDTFHYTEGKVTDKVDIAGSITPSKLTIQAARASLTRDLTKDVEFKNKSADRKPVFEGTYTSKKGAVKLNEFVLEGGFDPDLLDDNKITFYLLIDGDEVADAKLGADLTASDTFTEVEVDAGKSVKVVVEAEVNAKNASPLLAPIELGNFDLTLKGEDSNGNKAGEITKKTAKLKIVESGTAKISDNTSNTKTVTLKEAEAVLAEFTLKPANGASEVDFDYLEFELGEDGAGLDSADVTVYIDGVEEFPTSNAFTYAPTTTIDKDGVVVKVTLNDEDDAAGTITLTVKTINATEDVDEEFSKTFASALVYINSQTKVDKEYTKYTLGVKKYDDSDSIVGLKLYKDAACSEALELVGIEPTDKITDGKSFTITALDTGTPIKCIQYTVADEAETEITTTEASDFFKVGLKANGDDWYVYSNN